MHILFVRLLTFCDPILLQCHRPCTQSRPCLTCAWSLLQVSARGEVVPRRLAELEARVAHLQQQQPLPMRCLAACPPSAEAPHPGSAAENRPETTEGPGPNTAADLCVRGASVTRSPADQGLQPASLASRGELEARTASLELRLAQLSEHLQLQVCRRTHASASLHACGLRCMYFVCIQGPFWVGRHLRGLQL